MKLSFNVTLTVPYRTDKEAVRDWIRRRLGDDWWKVIEVDAAFEIPSAGEMAAVRRGEL
jgi:hypothetical protein